MLKPFLLGKDKMEAVKFSLGSKKQESKLEKKRRLRKEKEWKRKEAIRKANKDRVYLPVPKKPVWCILPSHKLDGLDFWIHTLKGKSFFEKKNDLLHSIKLMKQPVQAVAGFDPTFGIAFRKSYLEKAKIVLELLQTNQDLRWKFKIFFTKARILRFQKVNDVDPITLEPFKQPIRIHFFNQRKTYVFEADSLAKHLHKQLVKNDGHIPTPVCPKNPLTNEFFTLAQTIALIDQSKKYGKSSWAIEAFKACRFDITSFVAVHSKPLRLNALHVTMSNTKDWDCRDTLYDFIKFQHRDNSKHFFASDYKWAIEHAANEERLEKWRKLCIKWYELDILLEDEETKKEYYDVINSKIIPLCEPPKEIQDLRIASAKKPRQCILIN